MTFPKFPEIVLPNCETLPNPLLYSFLVGKDIANISIHFSVDMRQRMSSRGFECTQSGLCTPCPLGTYGDQESTGCIDCPTGKINFNSFKGTNCLKKDI